MLTTDAGEVYHFTPYEMPEAILSAFINIEGEGEITYAPADGKLEFDDEYPYQSAQISLAEPETYQLGARAADGWVFEKWLKDGEDFSTEAEITVELTEDVEFIAVFVKK